MVGTDDKVLADMHAIRRVNPERTCLVLAQLPAPELNAYLKANDCKGGFTAYYYVNGKIVRLTLERI
jgi:hypothetical protein